MFSLPHQVCPSLLGSLVLDKVSSSLKSLCPSRVGLCPTHLCLLLPAHSRLLGQICYTNMGVTQSMWTLPQQCHKGMSPGLSRQFPSTGL